MKVRNILVLSLSQVFTSSGPPLVLLVGGILGSEMASSPTWSTLPIAMMVVGVAVFTIPAALLMKKIGRRKGFIGAALMASIAALVAAYAININSFPLFCFSVFFIGGNAAFVQQYRFAAAESSTTEQVGKAVSFVLLGGIFAGYLGPEIGKLGKNWINYGAYTGSFIALAIFYLLGIVLLAFFNNVISGEEKFRGEGRPLLILVSQPIFLVAAFAGMVGYGVMTFIMTATPISMQVIDKLSIDQTATVIQSHIIAMFLPSLITGSLTTRFGPIKVAACGVLSMLICVLLSIFGRNMLNYWSALVLLGIGWNFLFVGGTTLLTQSYHLTERFRAQAANDFAIFTIQAFTSLSAGTVIFRTNWTLLNLINLPVLLGMLFILFWLQRYTRRPSPMEIQTASPE